MHALDDSHLVQLLLQVGMQLWGVLWLLEPPMLTQVLLQNVHLQDIDCSTMIVRAACTPRASTSGQS